ncbi:TRAP transporter small permease (plasmid) [Salipiger sp. H15]|uniref:TRAP transporter small permease protein n=1 Tax=Alloyangia sp. H15 TaxID=3029062 RepID=A0AAU8ARN4_9RHOB
MIKILRLLCVAMLAALIALPFLQVIMRDVFGSAIVGAEELTRFLLICTVFVAYPLVVRSDENIVMGELRAALPERVQRWLGIAITLLSFGACALIAVVTATNISDNLKNATPTLGIPFWIFLGACFVGFAGAGIFHALQLRKRPAAKSVSL